MGSAHAQEARVGLNGNLAVGDRALVSGDYVRVRTGPSLEHRILTKVNTGTEVTVIERGINLQVVGELKNYWYQVKLDSQNIEGWIYGEFLKKKEEPEKKQQPVSVEPLKPVELNPQNRVIELKEVGIIEESASQVASGDLDRNGKPEILFMVRDEARRSYTIHGYEQEQGGFRRGYSFNMRSSQIDAIEILSTESLEHPILAAKSSLFTYLYSYDESKSLLRLAYKLNTPLVSLGTLDGQNPFLVSLKKNRNTTGDGTVTYFVEAVRIEEGRGRFAMREKTEYEKPLPVKKLTLFDLDDDGKDEIIAEIGGGNSGGGITILQMHNGALTRILNTGIPTYNGSQFVALWGVSLGGKPRLVIYSTDPAGSNDASINFGFISASLNGGNLKIESFHPINKMLDEVNNGRRIVHFGGESEEFPFLVVDSQEESGSSTIKRASLWERASL